jgi:hypothetical protein
LGVPPTLLHHGRACRILFGYDTPDFYFVCQRTNASECNPVVTSPQVTALPECPPSPMVNGRQECLPSPTDGIYVIQA